MDVHEGCTLAILVDESSGSSPGEDVTEDTAHQGFLVMKEQHKGHKIFKNF
jgi:hypothetical protein